MIRISKTTGLLVDFAICNSPALILFLANRGYLPAFFASIGISLLIFIFPGLSWTALLLKNLDKRSFLNLFFWSFFASSMIMLFGNILLVLLNLDHGRNSYLIYTLAVMNAGIVLRGDKVSIASLAVKRIRKTHLPPILLFSIIFIFIYFLAASYIPPLHDNTVTIERTAYGLIHYLKPYTLNDDGMYIYDFAHPLLAQLYAANAILLSGRLDDMKYYYHYSQMAKKIKEEGPAVGEDFLVFTAKEESLTVRATKIEGEFIVLNKGLPYVYLHYAYPSYKLPLLADPSLKVKYSAGDCMIVENKTKDKNLISKTLYEQINLRRLLKEEYERFYKSPGFSHTRITNIFFVLCTLFLIFFILSKLQLVSGKLALFLCIVYISLPEPTVHSVGGSYTAISNFFLAGMAYFYLIENNNQKLSFLCGVFSGLSNHHLLLLPSAVLIREFFIRDKNRVVKSLIFGFLSGTFIYWIYGLSVEPKVFLANHFHQHFINRILHIAELGHLNYPPLFEFWRRFIFNLGWPFFLIGVISLLFLLVKAEKPPHRLDLFSFWFFTGAVAFSIVDWKSTIHLVQLVIPLIFGIAYIFYLLDLRAGRVVGYIKKGLLAVLGILLVRNFSLFILKDGYQMLERLYCLICSFD